MGPDDDHRLMAPGPPRFFLFARKVCGVESAVRQLIGGAKKQAGKTECGLVAGSSAMAQHEVVGAGFIKAGEGVAYLHYLQWRLVQQISTLANYFGHGGHASRSFAPSFSHKHGGYYFLGIGLPVGLRLGRYGRAKH